MSTCPPLKGSRRPSASGRRLPITRSRRPRSTAPPATSTSSVGSRNPDRSAREEEPRMRRLQPRRLLGAIAMVAALIPVVAAAAGDTYEYDAAGRLARVTDATGRIVDYTYDDNSNITAIISGLATAVEPSPGGPALANALRAGEPNPASRETRVRFSLARGGKATLRVFDVSGRLVDTVTDREYPPGAYE